MFSKKSARKKSIQMHMNLKRSLHFNHIYTRIYKFILIVMRAKRKKFQLNEIT